MVERLRSFGFLGLNVWCQKPNVLNVRLAFPQWHTTDGYMKRLAFQSDFLSNRCNVY